MSLTQDYIPEINVRSVRLKEQENQLKVDFEVFVDFPDTESSAIWIGDNFYRNTLQINVSSHPSAGSLVSQIQGNKTISKGLSDISFRRETEDHGVFTMTVLQSELFPSFLGYTFFITLNGAYLNEQFGVNPNSSFLQDRYVVSREKLIEGGEIVNEGIALRDQSGEIWGGVVEVGGGGEIFKGGTDERLQKVEVENTKIQDLRTLTGDDGRREAREAFQINQQIAEDFHSDFEKRFADKIYNQFTAKRDQEYFTRLCLTQRTDDTPSALFGINWHEIIRDASEFRGLAEGNQDRFQAIKTLSSIEEIAIVRKRVEEDRQKSRLGVEVDSVEPVGDEIAHKEQIVRAFRDDGEFRTITGDIEEKFLQSASKEVRFFSFEDPKAEDLSFGQYAYEVKIVFEDGTREFLREVQDRLNKLNNFISEYKQDMREFTLKGMRETSFSRVFRQHIARKFQGSRKDPGLRIAEEFTNILELLLDTTNITKKVRGNQLASFVSPKTGSPESVAYISEYVSSILDVLKETLSQKIPTNTDLGNSEVNANVESSSGKAKKASMTHMFPALLEAGKVPKLDLFSHWDFVNDDVVEPPTLDEPGFSHISPDFMDARVKSEQKKFYADPQIEANLKETESFIPASASKIDITPSKAKAKKGQKVMFADPKQADKKSIQTIEAVAAKQEAVKLQAPTIDKKKEALASTRGIKKAKAPKAKLDLNIISNDRLSDSYSIPFSEDFLADVDKNCVPDIGNLLSGVVGSITEQGKIGDAIETAELALKPNNYRPEKGNIFSKFKVEETPMQIRSLSLAASGQTASLRSNPFLESFQNDGVTSQDISLARNTYGMVHRVKKFDGFKKDKNDRELVKSSKWSTLSQADVTASSKPVLCRLDKVPQNPVKVLSDDFYKQGDIADKYFILDAGDNVPDQQETEFSTASFDQNLLPEQRKIRTSIPGII